MATIDAGFEYPEVHSYSILEQIEETGGISFLSLTIIETYVEEISPDQLIIRVQIRQDDLNDYKKDFIQKIERIVEETEFESPDSTRIERLLRELHSLGYSLYKKIFNFRNEREREFIARIFNRESNRPGKLKITSNAFYIDFEFLTADEKFTSTSSFLGLKYIFSKNFIHENGTGKLFLPNPPKLFFVFNPDLFWEGELNVFQDLMKIGLVTLVEQSNNPETDPQDVHSDDFDLLHIACHTAEKGRFLDFGHENGRKQERHIYKGDSLQNKFIFLNACKTGPTDIWRTSFAQKLVLYEGATSVLTANFTVKDSFAGKFSVEFWKTVFDFDGSVDIALHEVSKRFIEKNNWGGFLYSIYGQTKFLL